MVQLTLPKNSVPVKGKSYSNVDLIDEQSQQNHDIRIINVYRWSGDENTPPQIDRFEIDVAKAGTMVLDILNKIKAEVDPSLTFRKSCREGVCGSCAMNIDGVNTLACQKHIEECSDEINIYPLPHMRVLKDLVVDLKKAFEQFKSIKPWLNKKSPNNKRENLQSVEDRDKLDGKWECVMCFSCSTSCPSYWWKKDKYLGPAVLLQAKGWIQDSRDEEKKER
jgi:succinate dehydrogenase and fumarate reductase iron-sulfur protein